MGAIISFLVDRCIFFLFERYVRQQSNYGGNIVDEQVWMRNKIAEFLERHSRSELEELLCVHQQWVSQIEECLQDLTLDRPNSRQHGMLRLFVYSSCTSSIHSSKTTMQPCLTKKFARYKDLILN